MSLFGSILKNGLPGVLCGLAVKRIPAETGPCNSAGKRPFIPGMPARPHDLGAWHGHEQAGSGRLRPGVVWAVAALAALGGAAAFISTREPGFPQETERTHPYLLLHDWYGGSPVSSPSFIRENREYLDSLPFDGIVTYVRSRDLSINVSAGVLNSKPLRAEDVESCLQPLRGLKFRRLTENFAAVLGGKPPDFMDDWSVPVRNFALLAEGARQAGLRGIYFDNETYEAPWGDHPEGVTRKEIALAPYQEQARKRGREVMEAVVEKYPGIVVILLHGPYISDERAPAPLFPRWQTKNELLGPFFQGFVEGARGRATIVDGGELYHLREDREFQQSYEWRAAAASPAAKVRFGFGVYDRPFQERDMNPGILALTLTHALRRSDSYVWLYVEGPSFLRGPDQGGASAEWVDAVRHAREGTRRRRP